MPARRLPTVHSRCGCCHASRHASTTVLQSRRQSAKQWAGMNPPKCSAQPASASRPCSVAHLTVASRSDSLVHLSARDQSLDDVLQTLFTACYTSSVPYRPDRGNLRNYLVGLDTYF